MDDLVVIKVLADSSVTIKLSSDVISDTCVGVAVIILVLAVFA